MWFHEASSTALSQWLTSHQQWTRDQVMQRWLVGTSMDLFCIRQTIILRRVMWYHIWYTCFVQSQPNKNTIEVNPLTTHLWNFQLVTALLATHLEDSFCMTRRMGQGVGGFTRRVWPCLGLVVERRAMSFLCTNGLIKMSVHFVGPPFLEMQLLTGSHFPWRSALVYGSLNVLHPGIIILQSSYKRNCCPSCAHLWP